MPHPASLPPPAFSGRWITGANDMASFLTDWRSKWTGAHWLWHNRTARPMWPR
jgi:hypothetical protein